MVKSLAELQFPIDLSSPEDLYVLAFAVVLLAILIVAFLSRSYVFCQYLKTMTGIVLKPREVRKVHRSLGKEGVRELFLSLIIDEDLKSGPIHIPKDARPSDEVGPRGAR